uniref:Uncharacterized protein n=1 Tax=Bracon brevicornis TaxID=1563983 RepID=A0A6V7J8C8_9HYME
MDEFYVGINLQHWAIVSYSIHLWRQPKMKEHLSKTSVKCKIIDEKKTMPLELHKEINNLGFPHQIRDEMKLVVGTLGTRIRLWLQTYSREMDNVTWCDIADYIDHLQWNYMNCIDSARTMERLYKLNLLPLTLHTWRWLCEYCVEECIEDFWGRITKDDQYYDLEKYLRSHIFLEKEYLLEYWRLRMDGFLNVSEKSMIGSDQETADDYMFMRSIEIYHDSLLYFWNRAGDYYKMDVLNEVASFMWYDSKAKFATERANLPVLMFLITQLKAFELDNTANEKSAATRLILTIQLWPFNIDFFQVAKEFCNDSDEKYWYPIVHHLLVMMGLETTYIGHDSKTRQLIFHLWYQNVPNFGRVFVISGIYEIWQKRDIELLKYMVLHQESCRSRYFLLEHIAEVPGHSYRPNLRFLRQFVREVSQDIGVAEWFNSTFAERGFHLMLD